MLYTDDAAHVGGGVQPEVRGPVRPRGQHEHHQPPALQHPQGHCQVSTRQFCQLLDSVSQYSPAVAAAVTDTFYVRQSSQHRQSSCSLQLYQREVWLAKILV